MVRDDSLGGGSSGDGCGGGPCLNHFILVLSVMKKTNKVLQISTSKIQRSAASKDFIS